MLALALAIVRIASLMPVKAIDPGFVNLTFTPPTEHEFYIQLWSERLAKILREETLVAKYFENGSAHYSLPDTSDPPRCRGRRRHPLGRPTDFLKTAV